MVPVETEDDPFWELMARMYLESAISYALEALPEEVFLHLPQTVEITFRRQILLGTPIRCYYSRTEDGRHQVEIQSGEEKIVHHAFLWFYH